MDFAKTFDLELKEGRFLSADEYAGSKTEVINIVINEKATGILDLKNPIGQVIMTQEGL